MSVIETTILNMNDRRSEIEGMVPFKIYPDGTFGTNGPNRVAVETNNNTNIEGWIIGENYTHAATGLTGGEFVRQNGKTYYNNLLLHTTRDPNANYTDWYSIVLNADEQKSITSKGYINGIGLKFKYIPEYGGSKQDPNGGIGNSTYIVWGGKMYNSKKYGNKAYAVGWFSGRAPFTPSNDNPVYNGIYVYSYTKANPGISNIVHVIRGGKSYYNKYKSTIVPLGGGGI